MFASFSLTFEIQKSEIRREIFDFKNTEGQKKFHQVTSSGNKFASCFDPNRTFEENSNKYFKTLDDVFHQCFSKKRITSKTGGSKVIVLSEIQQKLKELTELKISLSTVNCKLAKTFIKQNIEDIESFVSLRMSEKNATKISEQIAELSLGQGEFS